jgi:hypothetical protein
VCVKAVAGEQTEYADGGGVSRRPLGRQDENQVVPVGFVEPGAPEAHLSEFSTELELIAGTVQFVAAFVV